MDTEIRLRAARGEGLGGWVRKVTGLKSTGWQSQNSHGDVSTAQGIQSVTL